MALYPTTGPDPNRCPTHPGELLREEVIPAVRQPKTIIAAGLGISRQHLHDVLAGRKPLSPELAAKVARMFGGTTETWIRMQAAHDAWHVERRVDLSAVPRFTAAE